MRGRRSRTQLRYYDAAVALDLEEYEAGQGEEPGRWLGRGAQALGLEGRVDASDLLRVTAGLDPCGPGRLVPEAELSVAGVDLTFYAPKSVSVLFGLADADASTELVASHDDAVVEVLRYLEDDALLVELPGLDGDLEPGRGLVAASYRHRMTRWQDPELHSHVVCAPVAEGISGVWAPVELRWLLEHVAAASALYQAHLRAEVRDRLGLRWGPPVEGVGELVDIAPQGAGRVLALPGRGQRGRALSSSRMALLGGS